MKVVSIILFFLLFFVNAFAQKKFPVVEMKQGKVFMKPGKLKLQSVTIYDPQGVIAAEKTFEPLNGIELPTVFQKQGEYTLVFLLQTGKKITRKLLIL